MTGNKQVTPAVFFLFFSFQYIRELGFRRKRSTFTKSTYEKNPVCNLQVLPSIRPHARAINIVRIPAPHGIEALGLKLQRSLQRWRVVQAQIGPEPVDDTRLGRHGYGFMNGRSGS